MATFSNLIIYRYNVIIHALFAVCFMFVCTIMHLANKRSNTTIDHIQGEATDRGALLFVLSEMCDWEFDTFLLLRERQQ